MRKKALMDRMAKKTRTRTAGQKLTAHAFVWHVGEPAKRLIFSTVKKMRR